MRLSVTIAFPTQVMRNVRAPDRRAVWRVCDAVSVNVLDSAWKDLALEAKEEGCAIRTHSYPGTLYAESPDRPGVQPPTPELAGSTRLNAEGARSRGFRDGQACQEVGGEAHEWNGEAGIWRGALRSRNPLRWHANPEARGLMEAYALGWRQSGCRRPLWDLSFLDPTRYYTNPAPVPESLKSLFKARSVMAYSTQHGAPTAQNTGYFLNRVSEAHRVSGGLPVNLVPGSGRLLTDGSNRVVGDHRALLEVLENPPPGLVEISPYIPGHGGWKQLYHGNSNHPSIYTLYSRLTGK